ncbi:neuropeptide CCHamide 1 isoform X1 [Anticarsia gemmatalis]|uniref:neuropeptide CCHamide 1 isoform X1 n=1 Tax=Anticarsia gemmatalis TaxID=129554 RepID=UPI003F7750FC
MDRKASRTSRSASAVTKIFALLLVICLVECATEQRINSRGSKQSNLIEKVNGWRSQRGGSCLSYGHSCWGAHGKRSGKPPGSAPDWYLTRLLRRMAANAELNRVKQLATKNDDIDAIYQLNMQDDSSANNKMIVDNDEGPMELPLSGNMEAKPMLDDDLLSKMKLWQIMRESPEEK